ncbi:MAG: Rieske (2Fe-2S) protein [Acidobacteria bacterium]|nr:Rieske (2Fe-2S) protein [Acidobacteriota bacterium]
MAKQASEWLRVAALSDVPSGEAKPVKLGDTRSIALFNVDGKIYATDNQCPHMGYPLTRGAVRHGVLTCDWHGRSFDLEGGGCFNYECDDLQTFSVDIRQGEIWIQIDDAQYQRRDEHLRLLWEGLLSKDRWTISKAIALLLKGGVPEEDIVEMILRHLGRRIASSHEDEADNSGGVSRLINGLKVGRRYQDADRLMVVATAACSVAGGSAERLDVVPLPGPVAWESIDRWTRMFSHDGQSGRIERCLFTAHHSHYEDKILPLLYECAVEAHFLGFADNILTLGYLAEFVDTFGWKQSSELVFNMGAKLIGRPRGEPERFRRDAVGLMSAMAGAIQVTDSTANRAIDDEDAFTAALVGANIQKSFEAVNSMLKSGVELDRLITTLVLLAADRMARTPVNVNAGWEPLTMELNLAASLRTAKRHGGHLVAAKGVFHAAWQVFANRWINIPARPLSASLGDEALDVRDEDAGVRMILNSIASLNVQDVGRQVLGYLNAGYSGDRLLREMGRVMLWDDTNTRVLPTLRTVFEEWQHSSGSNHPARYQLLVGLARYATDIRTNKDSGSATNTAMRFAEGKTTVEVFEQ